VSPFWALISQPGGVLSHIRRLAPGGSMPLFGHRREAPMRNAAAGVPGLAEAAAAQGWQPLPGNPFDGHLEKAVHDITRAMYGAPRGMPRDGIGDTVFTDAFRGSISGRTVIVANAWTVIEPGLFQAGRGTPAAAVCAAELPSIMPLACVQSRRFPHMMTWRESPTGNPAFDDRFRVTTTPGNILQVLTPDVQQRIMARDDWVFWAERYLLGCVSKGAFRSAGEVSQRIAEVMDIVAAIPESVLPRQVDHSEDGLIARISQLTSIEDAMAMLQQLTPADREQLARSDTPLAAFADVRTPQEAMARFQALDPQRKMQLFAMFMRVEDTQRGG
jgi:hypothetical protein